MNTVLLGVNIDHIATLRQARKGEYPSVLEAAKICEKLNVNGITMHLREDRRHIQDNDIFEIKKNIKTRLNLEMAMSDDVIQVAVKTCPGMATIVPEKREELTTEGGLDVVRNYKKIEQLCSLFQKNGIEVSLFIEPDMENTRLSKELGAKYVEFHTGAYAEAVSEADVKTELQRLYDAAEFADSLNLVVNAGHGLNIFNVKPVLKMKNLHELNIGHSIISRAVFIGLENAVMEMKNILEGR
ncbi:MAG: pyridoxine 5'-phosphate synthase [Spirochaetes bacterium]|nr:pyridoxine 5'-phosphate synthase [Spirochaetota bacterium]